MDHARNYLAVDSSCAVTSKHAGDTRVARLGMYLFSAAGHLGDALNGIQPLS